MKPDDIIVRCYLKRDGNLWVAICIDLCLAAQANSSKEAKEKLHAQITEHLHFAFSNPQFATQLLKRPAPLKQRLTYHLFNFICHVRNVFKSNKKKGSGRVYEDYMPLKLA